jgi:hypothetical protein
VSVRGLLSYRISVTQAILAFGVFVAFLSLLADGDLLAERLEATAMLPA